MGSLLLTTYPLSLLPSYAEGYLGMKVLVTISSKNEECMRALLTS